MLLSYYHYGEFSVYDVADELMIVAWGPVTVILSRPILRVGGGF